MAQVHLFTLIPTLIILMPACQARNTLLQNTTLIPMVMLASEPCCVPHPPKSHLDDGPLCSPYAPDVPPSEVFAHFLWILYERISLR